LLVISEYFAAVEAPLWYVWQQDLFQLLTRNIHLDPTSGGKSVSFVFAPGGGVSPIGRDLFVDVYVKDRMGW